jgi:hypothetical protein
MSSGKKKNFDGEVNTDGVAGAKEHDAAHHAFLDLALVVSTGTLFSRT